MYKTTLYSLLFLLCPLSVYPGFFTKITDFFQQKKVKKTSEILLATGINAGIQLTGQYILPQVNNVAPYTVGILGSVVARNLKDHQRRYLINGSITLSLFIIGNTVPGMSTALFDVGDSIADQFLISFFFLIANDFSKLSGRHAGEGLIDRLMNTQNPSEEPSVENPDIEMQNLQDYEALAGTSSGSASLNDSGNSDHSEGEEASQTSAEDNV